MGKGTEGDSGGNAKGRILPLNGCHLTKAGATQASRLLLGSTKKTLWCYLKKPQHWGPRQRGDAIFFCLGGEAYQKGKKVFLTAISTRGEALIWGWVSLWGPSGGRKESSYLSPVS